MARSPQPRVAPAVVALVAFTVGVPVWGWDKSVTVTTLSVDNGGAWGGWGDPEFCPKGSYATGFQLKVEPHRGFFWDDTGLNGVRLLCAGGGAVTSSEGPRGSWFPGESCPRGGVLVAFRLRVEPPRGLWDDTAATDLQGLCSDGSSLGGSGVYGGGGASSRGGLWGNWSLSCAPPAAGGVCGIRSRLEPHKVTGDNTGLNSVLLFCCP